MRKQAEIPGVEREKNKEVDTAAEAYVEARDKRMKLTEKEKAAKVALVAVMKKHGLTVYKDTEARPPLVVTLVEGEDSVKVTREQEEDSLEE